ncbi:GNAT family N-acetyltransferase [Thiomicrorhabdus sediminis]|uniref:GNAT family N-acetyltransferase n=1 Tax=Thiomicrorhabdus sediminis TaxID=2580412 RepID=UPI00143D6641|nr:GNAT family N-acetyltransferase [Thiomicrorhabdus sediminis]
MQTNSEQLPQDSGIQFNILEYPRHIVHEFELSDPEDSLTHFIKEQAFEFDRLLISKTYVAEIGRKVIGFISLTCTEIKFEDDVADDSGHPVNNFQSKPAVKITRLAVDQRYQRQGIGQILLAQSFSLVVDTIRETVGCRFLVLDARKDKIDWYQSFGFELVGTHENMMRECPIMFLDLRDLVER